MPSKRKPEGSKRNYAGPYKSSSYDPDKHPTQLIELLSNGEGIAAFCAENNIGERTFFDWIDRYSELEEAYQIAKVKGKRWLEAQGTLSMHRKDFQPVVWSMLMRHRCGMTEHRRVPIDFTKCKTAMEKLAILERQVEKGELTTAEIKNLAEYVRAAADIEQKTDIAERVEELMKLAGKK